MEHEKSETERCDWLPEAFEAFWESYPEKRGRAVAVATWDRLKLPDEEIAGMMSYLENCKRDGRLDHCVYVPDPCVWLYGRLWAW